MVHPTQHWRWIPFLGLLCAHSAYAQSPTPASGSAPRPVASHPTPSPAPSSAPEDDATLMRQMQAAAVSASPAGAQQIAQILARGPSPTVIAAGLDALSVMGRPEGASAVT